VATGEYRTVATPEPAEPSRRLTQAAAAERVRLETQLGRAVDEAAELRKRVEKAERRASRIRDQIQLLDQLTGPEQRDLGTVARPHLVTPEAEPPNGWLRGAAIRQAAVQILAARTNPSQPIHYTDWLALLHASGYGIQGRDPAAAFLTQIGRSPVVIRADARGTYTLDLDAPVGLRERLIALNEELLALHHGQQTIEEIASARDRRNELITDIARVERSLEEAVGAVGQPTTVEQTERL
jgi:hypothetical protein